MSPEAARRAFGPQPAGVNSRPAGVNHPGGLSLISNLLTETVERAPPNNSSSLLRRQTMTATTIEDKRSASAVVDMSSRLSHLEVSFCCHDCIGYSIWRRRDVQRNKQAMEI